MQRAQGEETVVVEKKVQEETVVVEEKKTGGGKMKKKLYMTEEERARNRRDNWRREFNKKTKDMVAEKRKQRNLETDLILAKIVAEREREMEEIEKRIFQ